MARNSRIEVHVTNYDLIEVHVEDSEIGEEADEMRWLATCRFSGFSQTKLVETLCGPLLVDYIDMIA